MQKFEYAFTLAEVLVTLVIIGVISAMTIPTIIQNTNKQEYYARLKKNYSVILNALKLGQVHEGMLGDNKAVFMPSESANASYETAVRFSKYLSTVKVCKNRNETGCGDVFYSIEYATAKDGLWGGNYPTIILSDGTLYKILQYSSCSNVYNTYVQDENGNAVLDENGNQQDISYNLSHCGVIFMDVNGAKKPNKFGEDVFVLRIFPDAVTPGTGTFYGGTDAINKILINAQDKNSKK